MTDKILKAYNKMIRTCRSLPALFYFVCFPDKDNLFFSLCNTPAVTQMILGVSYSISAPRLGNNTECKTTLHSVFPVQVVFQDFCLCV